MTEEQRWALLSKLDMGYSLDTDSDSKDTIIEDIITNDNEFMQASGGLCSRVQYMQDKITLEMYFAQGQEPPIELIEKLINTKKNVERYIKEQHK